MRASFRFMLKLCIPSWTQRFVARVGEERFAGEPGAFVEIDRTWDGLTRIDVTMGMNDRLIHGTQNAARYIALQHGPTVLAFDPYPSSTLALDQVMVNVQAMDSFESSLNVLG